MMLFAENELHEINKTYLKKTHLFEVILENDRSLKLVIVSLYIFRLLNFFFPNAANFIKLVKLVAKYYQFPSLN
jgi:hypothetical protein